MPVTTHEEFIRRAQEIISANQQGETAIRGRGIEECCDQLLSVSEQFATVATIIVALPQLREVRDSQFLRHWNTVLDQFRGLSVDAQELQRPRYRQNCAGKIQQADTWGIPPREIVPHLKRMQELQLFEG